MNLVQQLREGMWKEDLDLSVLTCLYGHSQWTASGSSGTSCRMGWEAVLSTSTTETLEPIDYPLTRPLTIIWLFCLHRNTSSLPQHCCCHYWDIKDQKIMMLNTTISNNNWVTIQHWQEKLRPQRRWTSTVRTEDYIWICVNTNTQESTSSG